MSSVFNGTATDCLADFLTRFPDAQSRHTLAEFIGIKYARPSRVQELNPRGERLLRLEVFLDLLGYRVKEFQRLSPVVQQFAQAIALELLTLDNASAMLDYPDNNGLFRLMLHGSNVFPHRRHRIQRFVETSQGELQACLTAKRRELKQLFPALQADPGIQPSEASVPPQRTARSAKRARRTSGSSFTEAATPVPSEAMIQEALGTRPARLIDDTLIVRQLVHLLDAAIDLAGWVNQQPAAEDVWGAVRVSIGSDKLHVLGHIIDGTKGDATPS